MLFKFWHENICLKKDYLPNLTLEKIGKVLLDQFFYECFELQDNHHHFRFAANFQTIFKNFLILIYLYVNFKFGKVDLVIFQWENGDFPHTLLK